ncbi:MAG: hypothetical protein HKN21_10440, partial [Candidatus Eisenbacteria bacterium]|nr:hypothetical protein [Candidatus Eisenbacteria bacterium]
MKDRRIASIEQLIDSGNYKLLSLDIFDTVVYRTVPRPKDLFFLVGRELLKQGLIWDSSTPESFTRERMAAEERARLKKPSYEVTLEEIYACFPKGYVRNGDPQALLGIELAFEQASVRLNPDMKALIDRAKSKGLATAFVSDTYFTQEQLQSLVGVDVD